MPAILQNGVLWYATYHIPGIKNHYQNEAHSRWHSCTRVRTVHAQSIPVCAQSIPVCAQSIPVYAQSIPVYAQSIPVHNAPQKPGNCYGTAGTVRAQLLRGAAQSMAVIAQSSTVDPSRWHSQ